MQSLHSFCTQYDIPKTTVKRWLNDQGHDTSHGMTPEAIAAAKAHFRIEDPQATAPPEYQGLTVVAGNHCTAIDLPGYQGMTVDLAQFRDSESLVIDDPLAAADQFLAMADQLQGALSADIAAREARLQQTRKAQAQIEAKAQALALEQRLYRLQAAQIDQAQTEETKALAAHLEALQALGKSTEA